MTVVYQNSAAKDNPEGAWTHALVMGIGGYPSIHKAGFSSQPLGSPVKAATAMADWFLASQSGHAHGFHCPAAPLGSLAVLASPRLDYQTPDGNVHACAIPNRSQMFDAVDSWVERLGTNPATRAVLHVCGHGLLDVADQVVLADNFGEHRGSRLWEDAFNLNTTVLGLIRKAPASFYVFVDACMEIARDLLLEQGVRPQSLVGFQADIPPKSAEYVMLRAAGAGHKAFADEDAQGNVDVPRFSKALIKALSGYCGRQKQIGTAEYHVTWPVLRDAVGELLNRDNRRSADKQALGVGLADGPGEVPLTILTRRPMVLVSLDVMPKGYRAAATMRVTGSKFPTRDYPLTAEGPAELELPQAAYDIEVLPRGTEFIAQSFEETLLTPAWREFPIKVAE